MLCAETINMPVTACAVQSVIVVLTARRCPVSLVMVCLRMTGVTHIVVPVHVTYRRCVCSETIISGFALKRYAVTTNCIPYKYQIRVCPEVRLGPHRVVTLYTVQVHQHSCGRVVVIVTEVPVCLDVTAASRCPRRCLIVTALTLAVINRCIEHVCP